MTSTEIWTTASANGIILTLEQLNSLERYAKELVYWNSKVNLISRKDEENIMERHVLHSLSLLKYIDIPKKSRCLDIGTGGGLPGIPLAIASDDLHMLLVDSIAKKIKITGMLASHTGLRNISAIVSRTEDLEKDSKFVNNFDFIFARAVSRIHEIMSWSHNLLKPTGEYVLYKGGDIAEEIDISKGKFPNFNFQIIDIDMVGFPFFLEEEKKIVVISRK